MEESMAARYWCHMCSEMVDPIMEVEVKCPFCMSGFVEEMSTSPMNMQDPGTDFGSDLSLLGPILLGMMGNSPRRRRSRRMGFDDDEDNADSEARHGGETELGPSIREIEAIIRRRRRRSPATILQLLRGIRAGTLTESENYEEDRDRDRERERVILINPFNQSIVVQGSYESSNGQNQNQNPIGSLGGYFVGPGLDLLLQHLAENDSNRYGTPPAHKEAIDALPTVTIKEKLQCSVCLDEYGIGTEAKEMPCKHKFHKECILPWLELHSSCPVCRYQLSVDESKLDSERPRNINTQTLNDNDGGETNINHGSTFEEGDGEGRNGSGRRFSFPWPFNSLFPASSSSQSGGSNSSSPPSS